MYCVSVKATILLGLFYLVGCITPYTVYNKGAYGNNKQPKKEQKYYQDIYMAQLIPEEVEFGHVKETPFSWEQRFEKINLDQGRHQGKTKWNNPKDGYGEFYYDFNHGNEQGEEEEEDDKKQTLEDILADGRQLLENGEVEFIDGKSFDTILSGKQKFHGGNYKTDPNQVEQKNSLPNEKYKAQY